MSNITFVYPTNTRAVSLTGTNCAMNCPWCGGHYLKKMAELTQIEQSVAKPASLLISGGWNAQGQLPWEENFNRLLSLKNQGIRLNIHSGLWKKEQVSRLKELNPVISFDFLLDQGLMKECGFVFSTTEVIKSYDLLVDSGLPVIPHLLLGRNRGSLGGDFEILKTLSAYNPKKLVLLIFIPTPDTAFADCPVPELLDLEKFFSRAQETLGRTSLILGCMRPGGALRVKIDNLAVKHNFSKIVMPAPQIRKTATKTLQQNECCAFD